MLKVAIIGSGFGTIGLLPAFDSIPGCRIVAICAKPSEQLTKECTKRRVQNVYTDWRLLFKNEDIDAVAIAVTPKAQYGIAKVALKKGIHVFAEKPLTANLKEAKELLALAKRKKITHGIDFMFPEIAAWRKAKDLIDSETFGALRHISVTWVWQAGDIRYERSTWRTDVKEGGGALSFYFSHGLHYLEHFCGKITDARAMSSYSKKSANGGEVGIDMLLTFKKGVTGDVHVSSVSPGRVRHELVFECERGVITLSADNAIVDNFILTTHSNHEEKRVVVQEDRGKKGEDERVKAVRKLAKRFVDACATKSQMTPSFAEGVRVQEMIDFIRLKEKLWKTR